VFKWIAILLVAVLIAAALGFAGFVVEAIAEIAQIIFFILLVVFVLFLALGRRFFS
jgi:uncharacterized membrane protein YtjA (UPF0391 family)